MGMSAQRRVDVDIGTLVLGGCRREESGHVAEAVELELGRLLAISFPAIRHDTEPAVRRNAASDLASETNAKLLGSQAAGTIYRLLSR
jgi:hypothetical protein